MGQLCKNRNFLFVFVHLLKNLCELDILIDNWSVWSGQIKMKILRICNSSCFFFSACSVIVWNWTSLVRLLLYVNPLQICFWTQVFCLFRLPRDHQTWVCWPYSFIYDRIACNDGSWSSADQFLRWEIFVWIVGWKQWVSCVVWNSLEAVNSSNSRVNIFWVAFNG